jgi:cytoskeleton protein RodZ
MTAPTELNIGPPGSVLRDARVSAGKSVTETAEALNLLKSYVEALECNDYSRFNSPLFARGYIKAYARYMELDEAPLLKDCDRICRREEDRKERHAVNAKVKAPGNARLVFALIAAFVVWCISVWVFGSAPEKKLDVSVLEERVIPLEEIRSAPSLGESLLDLREEEHEPTPDVEGEPALLALSFTENVWTELRDAKGNIVLSGVQRAGEQLSLTVLGPVELSMAYWPAVSATYNNHAIDLKELTQSNAVRVRIGEL